MEKNRIKELCEELENLRRIAELCQQEAVSAGQTTQQIQKWNDLLVDINFHLSDLQKKMHANLSSENFDWTWIRSLAKKIDFFETREIKSFSGLQRSVDSLFTLTIP